MAAPTCTLASLVTNYPQFQGDTLNEKQRLALKIWYAANELSVIGGPNYTNLLTSTLLTDTVALLDKVTDDELEAAQLAIYYNNAINAGANVSATATTFSTDIKCLLNTPMPMLKKELVFLLCKLGFHKSYPQ